MHTSFPPIRHLFVLLLAACMAASCRNKEQSDERPVITVSIEPLRWVTEQIGGDLISVQTLVPSGSNPEIYEPTPRQMMELSKSRAVFLCGYLGMEQNWGKRLKESAPQVPFVNLSQGIHLIGGHHHEGRALDHSGGVDPHIWTSPRNMRRMAHHICQALANADPKNTSAYNRNLIALLERIDAVNDSLMKLTVELPQRSFLIYHPTLSYLARDYGLKQLAIEQDGKEPTAIRLHELIDSCRHYRTNTLFIQHEFDTRHIELIARETGLDPITINPLTYDWESEMLHIVHELSHGRKNTD